MSFGQRWTADGRFLTFLATTDNRTFALHLKRADGTGADSVLWSRPDGLRGGFLTSDGHWIVGESGARGKGYIVARRTGSDTAVVVQVSDPRYEVMTPALSPDGKWLAYVSNETGRYEIYLRPFPNADSTKIPLSNTGGTSPVWAHTGHELFFISPTNEMMTVPISPGPPFRHDQPRRLFPLGMDLVTISDSYNWFDVSRDDKSFLMYRYLSTGAKGAEPSVVIHNWLTEIKAQMKAKQP